MTTNAWPVDILRPRNVTRHLAPRTTAGTVSASGFTQRVSVPAHAWYITYEGILIASDEQIRLWDAFSAYLEGGSVPVLVQLVGDPDSPVFDATTIGASAAGLTSLRISRADPALAGEHFTIGERLYRIIGVTTLGGGQYDLFFRPPLREPVATATPVSFNNLFVKCRLATDDEMVLKLEAGRMATCSVRFVEDPNPD